MKKVFSVDEYIEDNAHFSNSLDMLRSIMLSTELDEHIKWNYPVYTLKNKNVLSLAAFKNHFCIWFFNGVFLKDEQNLLKNAQEGKTKAMRQMRFECLEDINKNIVLSYVKEAIENQELGKEIKPDRTKKKIIIPFELEKELDTYSELKSSFTSLSNYKQREYCEYISSAKQEQTKLSRIDKIKPIILNGLGLNDKYRNS